VQDDDSSVVQVVRPLQRGDLLPGDVLGQPLVLHIDAGVDAQPAARDQAPDLVLGLAQLAHQQVFDLAASIHHQVRRGFQADVGAGITQLLAIGRVRLRLGEIAFLDHQVQHQPPALHDPPLDVRIGI